MNQELHDAISAVYGVPESAARIGLLENAIRLADSFSEEEQSFELRSDLIGVCTEYGQFMKALIAFSWCLAKSDEKPDEYDFHSVIWDYQALLSRAAAFDAVSLDKLNELHEDYRLRMRAIGATERTHHERMARTGLILRDKEMTLAAIKGIKNGRKDYHGDCDACIQNVFVQSELYFGTYEKAMEYAKPLISGKMSCNMIPLRTFGHMITHVYRAGDEELAKDIYKRGVRLIGNKGGFLEQIGLYLIYLAYADAAAGRKLFAKTLPWSLNNTEMPWSLFHFHMGAYVLFAKLAAARETGKMALNTAYPRYNPENDYKYAELAAYHLDLAEKYAARFDARNGTNVVSQMLETEKRLLQG